MKQQTLLFFSIIFTCYTFSQTQIGDDIDGISSNQSGTSVSLSSDGTIVAIGSPFNNFNGSESGLARVYEYNTNTSSWEQQGNDIFGISTNDQFGYSISLSDDGSIVAVGARFNGTNAQGHVRVFTYNTNNNIWEQLGDDIEGEAMDSSGTSVSLSSDGSIVAIGSPAAQTGSGKVRIYQYNTNNGVWEQLGSNLLITTSSGGQFGYSVSLSFDGLTIAIGARLSSEGGTGSGSGLTRILTYNNGSGEWEQQGNDIYSEADNDEFGFSVSLSSDGFIVAIGAPFNDGSTSNSGHVRVYQYTSGDWTQLGGDIDGESTDDESGYSVSLSNDGLIVGIGARANNNYTGHVRIYQYNNTLEIWEQVGIDIDGEAEVDAFGSAVSLSSDGSIVAIGAPLNDGNVSLSGHVRVYSLEQVLSTDAALFQEVSFYPNPTKDQFTIQLKDGIQLQKATIYNQLGQLISSSNEINVNVSHLSQGLYFVEVITNQGKATQKLIIE
jgi:hypothetical protein